MTVKLLFRHSISELGELGAAKQFFEVIDSRTQIKEGETVIARYSMLPYPHELQKDVKLLGGTLIPTASQHNYIADLRRWYETLKDITPQTWFSLEEAMSDFEYYGPYVLKGKTNSRKNQWRTHMYAANKDEMQEVYFRLMEDSLIGEQGVYIRKYEPLVTYTKSLSGQPITKEFRFFIFNRKIVASGFYWANYPEVIEEHNPKPNEVPICFLYDVIDRISKNTPFYVIDVAQKIDGSWIVVELNCGSMSGLSTINPIAFYKNLSECCNEQLTNS